MRSSSRWARIATLILPSLIAACFTLRVANEKLLHAAAPILVALWVIMVGALVMRVVEAHELRVPDKPSAWSQLDVLTSTGASLMWLGAAALIASGVTGWASLSVIGVLGLGTVYITTTWTVVVAGGLEMWNEASIKREILPSIATEGDPLREELVIANLKIPVGTRMFAQGRALRHGAVSRYALGADASRAEVKLAAELGPGLRGEHRVPPLALWFGDLLGIARTPAVHLAPSAVTVLPQPGAVDGARELLGAGGDAMTANPANKFPTEGTFRIREYVPGDDTRRIHWIRSLQQDQLVVRLPDEIPPAEPAVRLVLDTELEGVENLTCRASDDLLDALVRVWLGVGKALERTGAVVTLATVVVVPERERPQVAERILHERAMREALRLGARVGWQAQVPLTALLQANVRTVVVSSRPRRAPQLPPDLKWVVVPEVAWTTTEALMPPASVVTLPYPSGCADNRRERRAAEQKRIATMWQDRAMFSQVVCWTDWATYSGEMVARPRDGRIALAVIP